MPPRVAGAQAQRPQRGGGRGGRGRGGPAPRGGMPAADRDVGRPSIADNVKAVGVKRPGFGTAGRVIKIRMNSFEATVANDTLYQYDVVSTPQDLSKRFRLRLMEKLQEDKPDVFTSSVIYDGQAIMFSKDKIALGDAKSKSAPSSKEFEVVVDPPRQNGKPPKVYKLKITQAKEGQTVNLEVLHEFVAGRFSQDSSVLMAEMALNIAMRMAPGKKHASRGRSFYIPDGKAPLGGGLEVYKGFFQSLRPAIGRLLVNVDTTASVFYRSGPLIAVCMDILGLGPADANNPGRAFSEVNKRRLDHFLRNVKVATRHTGRARSHTIQGLAPSASSAVFNHDEYGRISVANYFKRQFNITLRNPAFPCIKVGRDAVVPMELCEVLPGQFCKSQLDPDQTKRMVEFSTMKPPVRFQSIRQGLQMLEYGQSEYVRQCGIVVKPEFIEVDARILPEPMIQCFPDADRRKAELRPGGGKWNMLNRKYYRPARITGFIVIIFESERRFGETVFKDMVKAFVGAAKDFGLTIEDPVPYVKWVTNRNNVHETLMEAGRTYFKEKKNDKHPGPSLILAVLPPSSKDLYNAVKRFGFIGRGIATQCLLSSKCGRANHQYWANIMLKVNVKLDGTNFVPNLSIIDAAKPTIVLGADAVHPPPGAEGKPSFTALASSVDSMLAKYIASNGIQGGGREMIEDLQLMCTNALQKWQQYQTNVEKKRAPPLRLFYIRDGVSEGEFSQVLEKELPKIKAACTGLRCNPKITIIIVVKRHHHRGETVNPGDADQSGNVPAGSTIDTGITHPIEHDYIQYSHGGILGTSRPARYTVLYDENGLSANAVQELTYGLAHSLPRATRSVSIPAPVYHAHIICDKRAIHFNPTANLGSDTASFASGAQAPTLQQYKDAWSPMHAAQSGVMYWM